MVQGFSGVEANAVTRAQYLAAGRKLAVRWCGGQAAGDAAFVCAEFTQRAQGRGYSKGTLRLYREQIIEYVVSIGGSPALVSAVRNLHLASLGTSEKKTSALKLQTIKGDDADKLLQFMRSPDRSTLSSQAADLFEASLIFGLRPVEWAEAKMLVMQPEWAGDVIPMHADSQQPTHKLHVVNAKHNAVRGNGDSREIYARLTIEQAQVIARCIHAARTHKTSWESWYKALSNALYYAGRTLWPRRSRVPCFYTARHQCIANAKSTGGEARAIAAVFGHSSDWTARKHYSRGSNGDKKRYLLAASRVSLAGVRNQGLTALTAANVNGLESSKKK